MNAQVKKTIEHQVVHAIISSQIALNMNVGLRALQPQLHKQKFKNITNKYLQALIAKEAEYDILFDKEEQNLVEVYEVFEKYVKAVSAIPIWEMQNMTAILKKYTANTKSDFEQFINNLEN